MPTPSAVATELLEEAILFFATELISPVRRELITVMTDLNAQLEPGVEGDAMELDRHFYRIRVNRGLSLDKILTTLAHEMVHVKQFVMGELKVLVRPRVVEVKWNGEYFDTSASGFTEWPWEIEAMNKEIDLALDFVNRDSRTRQLARAIQKQIST